MKLILFLTFINKVMIHIAGVHCCRYMALKRENHPHELFLVGLFYGEVVVQDANAAQDLSFITNCPDYLIRNLFVTNTKNIVHYSDSEFNFLLNLYYISQSYDRVF